MKTAQQTVDPFSPETWANLETSLRAGARKVGEGVAALEEARDVLSSAAARLGAESPPFCPGQRVLDVQVPWWKGVSVVTRCERHPRAGSTPGGYYVHHTYDGKNEAGCAAKALMAAPADWVDPPARPASQVERLSCHYDGAIPTRHNEPDDDSREFLAYASAYLAWAEKHLAPLGFEKHIAGARRDVAEAEAEVAMLQAAE